MPILIGYTTEQVTQALFIMPMENLRKLGGKKGCTLECSEGAFRSFREMAMPREWVSMVVTRASRLHKPKWTRPKPSWGCTIQEVQNICFG